MQRADPIRLDRESHRALAELAAGFATRSHIAFITEALVAARSAPDDPLAGLALLVSMQGTTYARRKDQSAALADVGRWLEQHLAVHLDRAATGAGSDRLGEVVTTELGWLRRLAMAREAAERGARRGRRVVGSARPFGRSLGGLRARWERMETEPPGPETSNGPSGPPPPPPEVEAWGAGFLDFLAARKVWQAARKRLDKGKPLKDKRVPLAVRAPELPPGVALEASFTLTAGLVDVWRASDAAGGQARDFFVVEWDNDRTPWLATRVAFEP